jgi:arylsulfatase A-like enzyme
VQIGLLPALKPSFNEADFTDKPIWRPPLGTEEIMGRPRTARVGLIEQYRSRLTALRAVDDLVRRVFVTLRLTGRLDNTVVIFVSDNGFLYGEHRLPQKLVAYEESIRVPLYIRVPWNTQPRSEDRIVLNNDLAPTIADLAGVVPGLPTDGRSLAPLLRGETPPDWRRRLLVEHFWNDSILDFATFGAIRNGPADAQSPDALYVEYYDQVTPQQPGDPVPPIMFRELYDLASDPFQLDSLHRDPGRGPQMESLAHVLAALRVCGGLPGQTACPELER